MTGATSNRTVEIEYGQVECRVVDRIPKGLNDRLHGECSYIVEAAQHIRRHHSRFSSWDGYMRLYHRSQRTFPAGLLPRVVGILREQGYEARVTGSSTHALQRVFDVPVRTGWELRPYQAQTAQTMLAARRCIVQIATGGGKTVIAGHVLQILGVGSVFLVHTKDLLYQARSMLSEMLGEDMVGQVGDGVVDVHCPVVVATLQTAARCLNIGYVRSEYDDDDPWDDGNTALREQERAQVVSLLRGAECVFMDECHRVAAPTAQGVVNSCTKAVYRFGLSASPWRDDGADLVLEGVFGHVAVRITASELHQMGWLERPLIRFMDVPIKVYPKGTRYQSVYVDYVSTNPERNALVVKRTLDLVRRGRPTLVLVRLISHGELLRTMLYENGLEVPFLSGKDHSTVRRRVLDDLRADRLPGLVATTIADEGLDIKPLSGLVLAGGGKSSTRALQRVGRVLRPYKGKNGAEVIDFDDNARFLSSHSAARLRIYRTEEAWEITDV